MLIDMHEIDMHFDHAFEPNLKKKGKCKGPYPEWLETTTGMPNWMIRSALFGSFRKGKAEKYENKILASFKNMTISYTGEQLDQGDLSVWLMIVQFAYDSETALGRPIKFSASDMLEALGKTTGGGMRRVLIERIDRLFNHQITLQQGRQIYKGRLITSLWRDKDTADHVVVIDRNLAVFYSQNQLTWINWKIRLELEERPLAQWLHCYYSSHKVPYENFMESLLRWSGSKNSYFMSDEPEKHRAELRSACQTLRNALGEVTKACALHGAKFSWDEKDKKIIAKLEFDDGNTKHPTTTKAFHAV